MHENYNHFYNYTLLFIFIDCGLLSANIIVLAIGHYIACTYCPTNGTYKSKSNRNDYRKKASPCFSFLQC